MPPLSGKGEFDVNSLPSVVRALAVVTILLAFGALGWVPASLAQSAASTPIPAQNSFCGSQPLCYEANDFAATITDFRTSTSGGYKVIDVIVRFQNKTNQPLILGYLANSGTALDDRGNRYIVYGANGFRGIGQVYGGNNFDPKFNLRGGGFGDAQFELMWAPGQTAYGVTFELNLTVDEINTIEANQHTLGGEFPLHYRGLANGVTGSAPGQASAFSSQGQGAASSVAGLPPCGTTAATLAGTANSAGVQVPATANTAVTNASAAFSSLGSLFGKKKTTAPAAPSAPNAASAAPCAPMTTSDGTATSTSAVNAAVPQTTSGVTSPTTTAAAGAPAPSTKAATTTTAKPVAVVKTATPPATATVKKPAATPAPPKKPAPTNQ
jgi:hypothetical protein